MMLETDDSCVKKEIIFRATLELICTQNHLI